VGHAAIDAALFVAFGVLPLLVAALLVRDVVRLTRPMVLIGAGRYGEARLAGERLGRSWMAIVPSIRRAARYSVASSLHLEGDLDGSLRVLAERPLAEVDANLRYAVLSLEAANLVLARRDLPRAVAALTEARKLHECPEDLLFFANALADLGRDEEAAELVEQAGTEPGAFRVRFGRTITIDAKALKTTMFHYLRGRYLVQVGRAAEAGSDLEIAARSPHKNVYARRARDLLARAPESDPDPRSSLAPQVMDE
jgi:tetratricopeptide (TPR) repeat protein